jgi:hypothetical protein
MRAVVGDLDSAFTRNPGKLSGPRARHDRPSGPLTLAGHRPGVKDGETPRATVHRSRYPFHCHVACPAILGAHRQHLHGTLSLYVTPEGLGNPDAGVLDTGILNKRGLFIERVKYERGHRYRHEPDATKPIRLPAQR